MRKKLQKKFLNTKDQVQMKLDDIDDDTHDEAIRANMYHCIGKLYRYQFL